MQARVRFFSKKCIFAQNPLFFAKNTLQIVYIYYVYIQYMLNKITCKN